MQYLISDSAFYWLLWVIFTLAGFLIGWTLRASWRERSLVQAYERSEQERNSLAHLYAQLRQQHDSKASELKKTITEITQLRQQTSGFDLEKTLLLNSIGTNQLRLDRSQAETKHFGDKTLLLEDQALHLRTRNAQLTAEFANLQDELQGWKTLQRDFSVMLRQVQVLENTAKILEQERTELSHQLDAARSEATALRARLSNGTVLDAADAAPDLHLSAMPSHRHENAPIEEEERKGVVRHMHPIRK